MFFIKRLVNGKHMRMGMGMKNCKKRVTPLKPLQSFPEKEILMEL